MDTNLIGNFLAIGAAITSALLQTMWKNSTMSLDNNQRNMLTSLVGVCNICIGWPLIVLLHYTGEESLNFLRHLTIQDLSDSFYIWSNFLYAAVLGISETFLMCQDGVPLRFMQSKKNNRKFSFLKINLSSFFESQFNDLKIKKSTS